MIRQLVFPFLMIGTETIGVCEGGGEPRVSEQVITFLLRDILCFVLFHTLKHLLYGVFNRKGLRLILFSQYFMDNDLEYLF